MKPVLQTLTLLFVLIFLSACKTGGSALVRIDNDVRTSPPVATAPAPSPPPHAPAHGRRAQYKYHYYPSSEVYFNPGTGIYFYLSNSTWRSTASLSYNLKTALGEYVPLSIDSDRPYQYHDEHKRKYPPGQSKKHNKHEKQKHGPKWK